MSKTASEKRHDIVLDNLKEDEMRQEIIRLQALLANSEKQAMTRLTQDMALRFREFAEAIPDFSLIVDEAGEILDVFGPNQNWLLCGQQLQKKCFLSELFSPDSAKLLDACMTSALNGDGLQQVELEWAAAEANRTMAVRIAAMSYINNNRRTLALTFQDLSDRRRVRRMVQNAYERRRRSEFFNELLQGRYKTEHALVTQCWRLGIDARCNYLPVVGVVVNQERSSSLDRQLTLESIVEEITATQEDWIAWTDGEMIGLLCQCEDLTAGQANLLMLDAWLKRHFPQNVFFWGSSEILHGLADFARRYEEAKAAAIFNRQYEKGGTSFFQELGMDQILLAFSDKEKKADFIRAKLGPLLDYDARKGTEMFETLSQILRQGNLKLVAETLFLHHKTVVFRKKRIEELLDCSLDDFETRMALVTAMKLKLLEERE